jgi:hypothetical protein
MSICSTAASKEWGVLTVIDVDGLRPLLIPAVTAFKLIGVKPTKGWKLIQEKKLETVHIGPRCYVVVNSIERLVEELRQNAQAQEQRKGLAEATAASLASRRRGQTPTVAEAPPIARDAPRNRGRPGKVQAARVAREAR